MRLASQRLLRVLLIGAAVLLAVGGAAFATTITTPNTDPFTVPAADADGNPAAFTVSASGLPADTFISIEQCDGSDPHPAPPAVWLPTAHCDGTTGNAPMKSDGSGYVTFAANDDNHRLFPFKGPNPNGGDS